MRRPKVAQAYIESIRRIVGSLKVDRELLRSQKIPDSRLMTFALQEVIPHIDLRRVIVLSCNRLSFYFAADGT